MLLKLRYYNTLNIHLEISKHISWLDFWETNLHVWATEGVGECAQLLRARTQKLTHFLLGCELFMERPIYTVLFRHFWKTIQFKKNSVFKSVRSSRLPLTIIQFNNRKCSSDTKETHVSFNGRECKRKLVKKTVWNKLYYLLENDTLLWMDKAGTCTAQLLLNYFK